MLSNCSAGELLDCREIKPVNPKGNQPWILIGRIDAEAEAPVLWPPDTKTRHIGKDPDAGKDWGQEKRLTEDEMVRYSMDMNLSKLWKLGKDRGAWHAVVHGVTKSQTPLSNWTTEKLTKDSSRHFPRENMQVENDYMKGYSTSLVIMEMQIKITARYYYTSMRMAKIKLIDHSKCWLRSEWTGILIHYWWNCEMVQPLWKLVWQFFKNVNIHLPYHHLMPIQ